MFESITKETELEIGNLILFPHVPPGRNIAIVIRRHSFLGVNLSFLPSFDCGGSRSFWSSSDLKQHDAVIIA